MIVLDVTVLGSEDNASILKILKACDSPLLNATRGKKIFTEGMSNKLFGVFDLQSPDEMMLFRIFGAKTELIIDRQAEADAISALAHFGFAEPFLAKFANGVCFRFIPGRTVPLDQLAEPSVYRIIASKLAEMHALVIGPRGNLKVPVSQHGISLDRIRSWLDVSSVKQNTPIEIRSEIEEELQFVTNRLNSCDKRTPLVLCHNDLLNENIIINEDEDQIQFIDFEYAGFNPIAADIGNHFSEFVGQEQANFELFPSLELRKKWISAYIEALMQSSNEDLKKKCADLTLDNWLLETHIHSMISDLKWSTWSYFQLAISDLKFDFQAQAESRMMCYRRKKQMLVDDFGIKIYNKECDS